MTRTRKWVSCACGYNWAWQRQVETGEDTHCSCCGRNWLKQLRKQQSSKEGKEGNSPRAVWDAGRGSGKGKGEGKGAKGQPGPPEGKVGTVLAGLWKDLRKPRRKPFSRQGSTRLARVARRPPPPPRG